MTSPLRTWSLRSRLTLGVVALSAVGFLASSLVAQSALKSYLTSQIDHQLEAIAGGTLPRIVSSGIAHETFETNKDDDGNNLPASAAPSTPLQRIPTTTSLTVLDSQGKIVGGLGGDLNSASISDYVQGLLPAEVAQHGDKAFTIEAPGADFRAIARSLPNNSGTVVAAQSLADLDNTVGKLGFLFFVISLVLLLLMAIAARTVIKVGLQPLEDAEETAEEIASGNLSARMPEAAPKTEVGRLVNSLNAMLSRIEESFAVRTESENKLRRFVADASHELRTPLTAIRGFAELHRQGAVPDGEKTKELLGRIEKESVRMGALVDDLLLLARLDQSRDIEFNPVDLAHVIEETVASASAAGPEHPITVEMPKELFVLGDSGRIYQVMTNLLANARVHTPSGTAINVLARSEEDGVYVSVADSGPGLSEEDQKRIFERFFRADPSRQRTSQEGSGLGLSIVDSVMQAHGGKVGVVSKPGAGTTFTLFFPTEKA